MKYTATIAIMDDVPDLNGETLADNVEIPDHTVPVSVEFDKKFVVGMASIVRNENCIEAEIEIDEKFYPTYLAELMTGVVGGTILSRVGPVIEKWTLKEIGLTQNPCDTRLPKLKRKE